MHSQESLRSYTNSLSYRAPRCWEKVPPRLRFIFGILRSLHALCVLVAGYVGIVCVVALLSRPFLAPQHCDEVIATKWLVLSGCVSIMVCISYVWCWRKLRRLLVGKFGNRPIKTEGTSSFSAEMCGYFTGCSLVALSLTTFLVYIGVQTQYYTLPWVLLTFTIGAVLVALCVFPRRAFSLVKWSIPAATFLFWSSGIVIVTSREIAEMERKAFSPIVMLVGNNLLLTTYLVGWPCAIWFYLLWRSARKHVIGCAVTTAHLLLMILLCYVEWPEAVKGIDQFIPYYGVVPVIITVWGAWCQRRQGRYGEDLAGRTSTIPSFLTFLHAEIQQMQETRFVDEAFSPESLVEFLHDIYWDASLNGPDGDGNPDAFQVQVLTPVGVYADVRISDNEMIFRHLTSLKKDIDPGKLFRLQDKFRWSACITYVLDEEFAAAVITYRVPIPTGTPFSVIVDAGKWFGAEVFRWYQETREFRD